ncbi:MAG: cardiolipin synthase [Spirochaetales bacterium]|nr:cardiolipin synthase [Spirochaetales bacterium]
MDLFLVKNIFFFLFVLYITVIAIKIILDNKPPEVLMAWLLVLILLPYLGGVIYLFAGVDWKKKKIVKNLAEESFKKNLSDIVDKQKEIITSYPDERFSDTIKAIRLLLNSNSSILSRRNDVSFFHNGADMLDSLIVDLNEAKESIHMEFYIWRSDATGRKIKNILIRKAKEGVDIRLIFDGVGCFRKISYAYRRELKNAGIQYKYFLDPFSSLNHRMINYRNHRKIVVIDGDISYTGGMNIGDEYINGGKRFDYWRDTQVRVVGEASGMLQSIFYSDWKNSGGEEFQGSHYYKYHGKVENPKFMQIVCSGPDSKWSSIQKLFLSLISNANERVIVQSPYFIPDRAIQDALETASLSGIDVSLIVTGRPDKKIPYWVAETYFESLLRAGVKIYRYEAGFFHSKVIIIDDTIASVGTCNVDVRSFRINYEVNAVFYDYDVVKELSDYALIDISQSREIKLDDIKRLNIFKRLRNSIFRIIAPVL